MSVKGKCDSMQEYKCEFRIDVQQTQSVSTQTLVLKLPLPFMPTKDMLIQFGLEGEYRILIEFVMYNYGKDMFFCSCKTVTYEQESIWCNKIKDLQQHGWSKI